MVFGIRGIRYGILLLLAGITAPAPLPPRVDLRPSFARLGLAQRRQGDRPTCSVFAVTGALEFTVARREGRPVRLSVEFLNWAANAAKDTFEDGGFFSELWAGFTTYGIPPEADMPYAPTFDPKAAPSAKAREAALRLRGLDLRLRWIKEWNVKTGLTESQFLAIKRTLASGQPVCAGMRWPKRAVWTDGVLGMCPPEGVRDGHSVILAGYEDDPEQPGGGTFLMRDSGKGGPEGRLPYAFARAYINDAVWIDDPAVRR
ncbi:MAG: C1 family peptidase [Planctomycetes bacterium]|nr:C1 family peptidase [Planctomycetota bacterium]